ncbi:glycosyltransferase family 39 protein [Flexivirga alba]|uniref:Glycosyltransferase family 39 protein n=1 Tax=Flexivirga alba TaxID=702742 RepID=A0ABW2AB81_9MICO
MPVAVWVIAAGYVVLELAVSGRYGFQQDELYFLVASHHLAFGYVDQPPLAVLLTRTTDLFGVNPTAIRILPALAGGIVIVLSARLAALFGGRRGARVIAALAVAITPILLGAMHIGNTTPYDLLAWTVVTLCVATALLRSRPRWWLGAGIAAGIGINDEYLILTLLATLVIGIALTSAHRGVLASRWPWFGGVIALLIWLPNLVWQFANGWPQLTMASALHAENTSTADYLAGLPLQFLYAGLLGTVVGIAGLVALWRSTQLRFLAVAASIILVYVLAWVPGKVYYVDGVLPVLLAAGAVSAERRISRARRPRRRRLALGALAVVGTVVLLPSVLPVLPVAQLHTATNATSIADGVGWPQLADAVAAQDKSLTRAGHPPTSIFTGAFAEAGALRMYGAKHNLPPAISGHNAFWTWGPGDAADTTVLYVDAADQLRPYFASCRRLSVYNPPYQIKNDWNDLPIGVCTGPTASWKALWPKLRHYD